MQITAYDIAQRFVGTSEVPGRIANPMILAMLQLDSAWPDDDAVPWCSAFLNFVAWLLRLPRSKSLRARSWLGVGLPIPLSDARPGFDVVILSRGDFAPGPSVLDAPGHVGLYAGPGLLLAGNQGNAVSVAPFDSARVLGVRRLA